MGLGLGWGLGFGFRFRVRVGARLTAATRAGTVALPVTSACLAPRLGLGLGLGLGLVSERRRSMLLRVHSRPSACT